MLLGIQSHTNFRVHVQTRIKYFTSELIDGVSVIDLVLLITDFISGKLKYEDRGGLDRSLVTAPDGI